MRVCVFLMDTENYNFCNKKAKSCELAFLFCLTFALLLTFFNRISKLYLKYLIFIKIDHGISIFIICLIISHYLQCVVNYKKGLSPFIKKILYFLFYSIFFQFLLNSKNYLCLSRRHSHYKSITIFNSKINKFCIFTIYNSLCKSKFLYSIPIICA